MRLSAFVPVMPCIAIAMSGCSVDPPPEIPDDATVTFRIGSRHYTVPLTHVPSPDDELGVEGGYDNAEHVFSKAVYPTQTLRMKVFDDRSYPNIFIKAPMPDQISAPGREIASGDIAAVKIGAFAPNPASTAPNPRHLADLSVQMSDGSRVVLPVECGMRAAEEKGAPPRLNICIVRYTIAGGNVVSLLMMPGNEPAQIEEVFEASVKTIGEMDTTASATAAP